MTYTSFTKEHWKGSVITSPLPPTLVTCSYNGKDNVFTVAWTGILNTQPPITYISVRPERYSYELIKKSGEFVINLPTEELVRAVDYCGVKTGKKVNKFAETGIHTERAVNVNVPIITECPVNIECKVRDIVSLGTHDMFMADIVCVNAAKELLDRNGRLCLDKAKLIAYAHGDYYALGRKLGNFGFSVKKAKKGRQSNKIHNKKGK